MLNNLMTKATIAATNLKHTAESLVSLFKDVGLESVCDESLKLMEASVVTIGEGDETDGQGWVLVGLLQCHMLAPQGPVDPAHRHAAKLQYARDQVCIVSRISNGIHLQLESKRIKLTSVLCEDVAF